MNALFESAISIPLEDAQMHLVYLLKRKSDSLLYVGITSVRKFEYRMACHRRSSRFAGDDFDAKVVFSSDDRNLVETKEGEFVKHYDTHFGGLNLTKHGAGHGHCSHKFTTQGFKFSDESRLKMANSAKARAANDEPGKRKRQSAIAWTKEEYRAKQNGKRAGKRLCPPKLSDEAVAKLRNDFECERSTLLLEVATINAFRKTRGYYPTTCERLYATKVYKELGVTNTCVHSILINKTRTNCLPALYKS